jgi:hypothetical protein
LKGKHFREKLTIFRVNVSLSHFLDMLIDYPNSKDYATDMLEKLLKEELLNQEQIDLYKKHIENLGNLEEY